MPCPLRPDILPSLTNNNALTWTPGTPSVTGGQRILAEDKKQHPASCPGCRSSFFEVLIETQCTLDCSHKQRATLINGLLSGPIRQFLLMCSSSRMAQFPEHRCADSWREAEPRVLSVWISIHLTRNGRCVAALWQMARRRCCFF